MFSCLIRKAVQDDAVSCCEMLAGCKLGTVYYPSKSMMLAAIQKAVSHDSFLVAVADNEIAGFIWYQETGMFHSFPYLHMIVVKEDMQHKGIGRQLLTEYEQGSLEKLGTLRTKSYLLVADFNNEAFEIYKKNGYQEINCFNGLFRRNVNERLMMKIITRQKTDERC